ncbi:MAG: Ig-like domain-containing protein, partial [Saprospiraceae bacterium]|nr:Ig-like domain-containing protein [Saprospiraceae bacterium]
DIRLTFNEWVQLKDAPAQVVISPPLVNNPEITLKGKSVIYRFHEEEVLNDNTTYTINFGSAIQDLTESNPAENVVFVFSTGSFIDSLSVSGSVVNAETGKPEEGIYAILHHDLSDTAMATRRPAYFARTSKDGQFRIDYIREDTFRVYALRDANLNYLYDQESEMFAFASDPVYVQPGVAPVVDLKASIALPDPVVLIREQRPAGVIKVALSRPVDTLLLNAISGTLPPYWLVDEDTMRIWHRNADTAVLEVRSGSVALDTLSLYPYSGETPPPVDIRVLARAVHPEVPVVLLNRTPVAAVNPELVRVRINDSTELDAFTFVRDSADARRILLQGTWPAPGRYALTLLPGAVRDFYETENDSSTFRITVQDPATFGAIRLNISGLDPGMAYVLQLRDGQNVVRTRRLTQGREMYNIEYQRLPSKQYTLRLVEDRNQNGRWDPGDFATLSQPERLLLRDLEPLRPGWDVDVTVTWNEE